MVANGEVPDTITITDPADSSKTFPVKIGYKGKSYHCSLCQERHVGGCPVKQDFYEAKELRATAPIKKTILADSTLRLADSTGLCANIICMSGGRVGHVVHMMKDAPKMDTMSDVIVVAGTNDIKQESESEEEFAAKVTKAVGQFQDLAFHTRQALTFIEPPLQPALSPLGTRKRDRFNVIMDNLSTKEHCEFKYVRCNSEIQMANGHPTVDGTKALVGVIDQAVPIITNSKFIATERLYNGVASAYRYGCLNCLKHRHVNCYSICPDCAEVKAPDPTLLTTKGDTVTVPSLEVHMSESDNKRLTSAHTESTPSKIMKSNDGGHN